LKVTQKLLHKLTRVTSSGKYIPEIDGLRFLAITPVVLFHLRNFLVVKSGDAYAVSPETDWVAQLTSYGHYGVELFFVISGFVLALPFAAHYLQAAPGVKLKSYYLRRLTRLEPPYVLWLLVCFCLFILINKSSVGALLPHLATGLFYSHSLVYAKPNILNLVTWSLEVEIQFYLLVPLLAKLFTIRGKTRRRGLLLLLCLCLVISEALFITTAGRLSLSILNFLEYFLIGFLLADVYLCDWNEAPAHHVKWDVASLVGWPLLIGLFAWLRAISLVLPFMLFGLYYSVFRSVHVRRLLTQRLLTVIGGMCYTIYLIHFQLISFVGWLFPPVKVSDHFSINYLLELLIILPVLALFTVVFFVCVERPCMKKDWPARLRLKLRGLLMPQTKLEKSAMTSIE
jgi:peptidoglycan/LPS O-acetylase OafA/YrhL